MSQQEHKEEAERVLAEVDRALSSPKLGLAFPPDLERRFDAETGLSRSRGLARGILLFAVVNFLFLPLDYFSIHDSFMFAVYVRIGVNLLVLLPAAWIVSRNPHPHIREGLTALQAIVCAAMVYVLVISSKDPLRQDYHYGILFIMMISLLMLRLRFVNALPIAFVFMGLHLATVLSIDTIMLNSKIVAIGLIQATVVTAMVAVYNLEKRERQIWLRSVADRLRAQIFEELAVMDPMTGLGNRRALQQWVELKHSTSRPGTMSLIMVDIDCFKAYNDTYGHLAGDDCIRRVAGALLSEARKTGDRVFRFGGEEFVVLLDGLKEQGAVAVAERMRRGVAALGIPHKASPVAIRQVTASFGVGAATICGVEDIEALIGVADAALYEAKNGGRNRVSPPFLAAPEPDLQVQYAAF